MADVARDSLSNLSLILRKTGPALDTPGLVARFCGLGGGEGGRGGAAGGNGGRGGGGVLVAVVAAFGMGEEKMLPHLCHLFEVILKNTKGKMGTNRVLCFFIVSFLLTICGLKN